MTAFLLPDLGEGLTEAQIVAWRVRVGDMVSIDQAVVEVETAKAVVEVPVPVAGRITELHGRPGDVMAVGKPLITVQEPDGGRTGEETEASGSVLVGYGTAGASRRRRRRPAGSVSGGAVIAAHPAASVSTTASVSAAADVSAAAGPAGPAFGSPSAAVSRIAVVSPLVRRLARGRGLDLSTILGSGSDGLITRRDVDRALHLLSAAPAQLPEQPVPRPAQSGSPEPGSHALTHPSGPAGDGLTRIPIRGYRKAAADKLSRSRREIPEATVWVDADATELAALRAALNADGSAPKISVLALLARFAVAGLRRFPELNARIEGDEIVLSSAVHLGFATQTQRGLLVPVLPDAQDRTLDQLAAALTARTAQARAGKLAAADLAGGTFTINNYGIFGVDGSAAIINHPEVAILGIGRIIERPWVVGGQVVPRLLTQLTLAFDHRACDGAVAGGFLRFVADCVESPARALRHL